jgi:hypothetical protein
MKMTDRIKRNMQPDKQMTLISPRLSDHVIEDLKEVAQSLVSVDTRRSSRPTSRMGSASTWPKGKRNRPRTRPSRSSARDSLLMEYQSRPSRMPWQRWERQGKAQHKTLREARTVAPAHSATTFAPREEAGQLRGQSSEDVKVPSSSG